MTWIWIAWAAVVAWLASLWWNSRRRWLPPEPPAINFAVTKADGHIQVFIWEDRNALAMEDAILKQQQDVPELWMCNEDFFRVTDAIRHSAEYRGVVR